MNSTCFHCGLINPQKPYKLVVEGDTKYFCCLGCQSAAKNILESGLGEYYKFHKPDQHPSDAISDHDLQKLFSHFDQQDTQAEFVTELESTHKECILIVEGISCSACSWLIEKRLLQLFGVIEASVNAGTHRLTIRWDSVKLPLSEIFAALYLIGYKASPFLADQEEQIRLRTQRSYILRLGIAGIGMMQAMMNAVALYSGEITPQHELWLWWTSLALTMPVILISAWPFFVSAWHAIKAKQLSMDVSVSIAILSAFAASCYATFTGHGEVYYESVNMFTFFLVLSRYLEFRARSLAHAQGNALQHHLPQFCTRMRNGIEQEVSIKEIRPGDILKLLPGETCPIDGIIVSGQSEFDESSFTGEFKTVSKTVNDTVIAGTINQFQTVMVKTSKTGASNSFNLLRNLVERASAEKPRIAELADRGSRQFIWSTLIISFLIGICWLWIDASRAYWIVVSVLVVTCPCALSLATPTALAQATLNLKRKGFVITRGYVLERLAELDAIAFDKTGTLTEGSFSVVDISLTPRANELNYNELDILAICSALEQNSEHNIASAFQYTHSTTEKNTLDQITNQPGIGVTGTNRAGVWFLGSQAQNAKPSENGLQLTLDNQAFAYLKLDDQLRSTAEPLFAQLSKLGIQTHILTGDPTSSIEPIFRDIGLSGDYQSGCRAEEKVNWVKSQQNKRIAVAGDGLNDAPLLAASSTSIAVMNATDMTKSQADVLMLTSDLQVIATAIKIARKTKRIIRQNLIWALVYNAVALPIAALGWVSPWQAAIGMSLSSLLVVGNALRLRK